MTETPETLVTIRPRRGDGARQGLYIRTFGCQMNQYDSDKLARILEKDYSLVDAPHEADLILVNTCSVRDKPEHKLYSLLGELAELKATNPQVMIGVGGCVAQQEGKNIISASSAVDFVFGTHNLSVVPSLVARRREGAEPQVAIDYRDEWEELPLGYTDTSRISRFIAISRGCNKNCTYCIVPTTRGPEVSRHVDEIEKEVRIALHQGAKEIFLLGQTVNSYGRDLTPRMSFVELLHRLSEMEALRRIRFISPHPQEVREDFIELVATNPKICRHIHMPLQAGSNRILKAMNRNYRRERYLEIIESLRSRVPDISITTDIIVGFPGETEGDFQETMEMLELVQYDAAYSYIFSPRPGTVAATLKDDQPYAEKLTWLKRLQARQDEITTKRLASWVGKEVEVLLEGPTANDPSKMQGKSSQSITVNLQTGDASLKAGMIVKALVNGVGRYTLKADVLGRASAD